MTLIDGKATSQTIRAEIAEEVLSLKKKGIEPTLAVILVGEDPASCIYVRNKHKACLDCGIRSLEIRLPGDTTESELLSEVRKLNGDPTVDGILVQLPLPKQIRENVIIEAIDPKKDVDAFHPENVGRITLGSPKFLPCTPAGIMELLDRYGIDPAGKKCVVIGRSNIVGKPISLLMLSRNATVSICHSKTKDLLAETKNADILVVAVGKAGFVTGDMVKPGAVVIDVGINRNVEGKVVGDVDFASVADQCSYITPVPGGVGPMTIAMLLRNTLTAAKERAERAI